MTYSSPIGLGSSSTAECQREYIDDARFEEMGTLYRWDHIWPRDGREQDAVLRYQRPQNEPQALEASMCGARTFARCSPISAAAEGISFFLGWLIVARHHQPRAPFRPRAPARGCASKAVAPKVAPPMPAPAPAADEDVAGAGAADRPDRRRRQRPNRRHKRQRPRPRYLPARLPPRRGGSSRRL